MIRVEKTHLPVAALTHPGMKGKNNEDRFGVTAFRIKSQPDRPVLLAVLSDGIGGNRAGEVASEMAVNLISQYVAESDGQDPRAILEQAIHFASERIHQQAQGNTEQQGMGATCACAWISGDLLITATVGDSRIYLMRGGGIQQVSTDHTWIQEALERGLIQPEEVNGHPNAHVIRRYLGSPAPPEVDFRMRIQNGEGESIQPSPNAQGFALQPGDCLLLCSDGLTDLVSDEEILAAFKLSAMETAGHRLIDMANQRGGHDNITLVAIQVPVPKVKTALPFTARRAAASSRRVALGCLGVIALAIVAGALAGRSILNPGSQATPTIIQGTPSVTPTRTPLRTSTVNAQILPLVPTVTNTPALALPPASNAGPTITPWPTNTPGLPIVTRSP